MSVTLPASARAWARAHRAALAIVVLSVALAASLGMLAARLTVGPSPAPATSVTFDQLPATDDGCMNARPGQPC